MARPFFAALIRSPVSLIGTALAAASLTLILALFAIEVVGFEGGAYLGILTYLILPAICILGLLLIPLGIHRQRLQAASRTPDDPKARFPVIDMNSEQTRRSIVVFLVLTMIITVVLATATYKGVEVMESDAFCGTVCHTPMQPEHTAHQHSPHARVRCADCHIGPGADWFVKSKLSGAWQLVAVSLDIFPRPIHTPIENLRPARDTCEQCHWPTKFVGDRLNVKTVYADDEANTELKTAVLLKVGGVSGREASGIHWHVDPGVQIRYQSDADRMKIYDVELTRPDGTVHLYRTGEQPEGEAEWRVMDCVDCHNRPAHRYKSPDEEVNAAMADGRIDTSLPYIKREGVKALEASYDSHEQARDAIAETIRAYYTGTWPDVAAKKGDAVAQAVEVLGDIYAANIFPTMQVRWDTYPEHIGHQDSPGCFRCHDRKHKTEAGESISRSCSTCHTVLAEEEADPEILQALNP